MTRAILLTLCIAALLLVACGSDAEPPECYSDYPECDQDAAVIVTAAAYPVKTDPRPGPVVTPNWPPGK